MHDVELQNRTIATMVNRHNGRIGKLTVGSGASTPLPSFRPDAYSSESQQFANSGSISKCICPRRPCTFDESAATP